MKLLDAIRPSIKLLEKAGIDDPLADAEMLVFHAVGMDRLRAYTDNPEIGDETAARINVLVTRRAHGEPLQYIVGEVDFLGLKIKVGRGVLVPRPETELLAQQAIKIVQSSRLKVQDSKNNKNQRTLNTEQLNILDLCTGSGCLSLFLAKGFPQANIYGTDISAIALRYAQENADINMISNVRFLNGSLFAPLDPSILFDLIISNPPYIKRQDISTLQREVRDWEPVEALDGGADGLVFYRKIFAGAAEHMKKGAAIILELGFDQAAAVRSIAEHSGFKKITVKKDFAGIDRILTAEN